MRITLVTKEGLEIAEIKNCKTIKGARTQLKKTSFTIQGTWIIRIEENFITSEMVFNKSHK